ncbi:MAG TPA: cytochrome c [Dongiaceae bacterium]|nr:cytochrome c [Dongiaceae bacterium]
MRILAVMIRGLVSLALLLILITLGAIARGFWLIHRTYDRPVAARTVAADSTRIARGAHLAQIVCAGCHASDPDSLPTGGAANLGAEARPALGELWAPNLTAGGALAGYGDAEIDRAMRQGIRHDATGMVVMPSRDLRALTPADGDAIIAYLRSLPAVRRDVPERNLNVYGYLFLGLGLLPTSVQDPSPPPRDVTESPTLEYGAYLVAIAGCRSCHGPTLHGGSAGPGVHAPDIASPARQISLHLFERAVRSGVGFDGHALDPHRMPWLTYRHLTELEMAVIYEYTRASLP